jgi:hypothetical protein
MCDDIKAFASEMGKRNIDCGPVLDRGWGLLAELSLPGGGKLGVYQPRHARPKSVSLRKKPAKKAVKKRAAAKAPRKTVAKKKTRKR